MQKPEDIENTIILIGCEDATVAAIAKSIASHLTMPFLDLQENAQQYFDETDFQEAMLEQAYQEGSINGVFHYMRPYHLHAIKRGVEEHPNCVIRLGALQAVFDDADNLKSISDFLQPYNVVLFQPVEDKNECIRLVRDRNSEIYNGMELNEYFLTHQSNFKLAKQTVYTKDKTPEQTAEETLAQLDSDAKEIILIGAQSVGKTTVGKHLSEKLGIPQVSLDKLRWKYFEETDWNPEQQREIAESEGFIGVFQYWKRFDLHAVERVLQEHKQCVIDFGAGQSVFDNQDDLSRMSRLLAPYANVVHLLPSPDKQESIDILKQRRTRTINNTELFEFIFSHDSYDELAKHVVYTEQRTPEECRDAVLKKLGQT